MGSKFTIDALSMFQLIIQPAFQDLLPSEAGAQYRGMLQEFTIMDDVPYKRTIVDLKRVRNILQRRDGSCDLVYKKVMGASTRIITVDELYAATNHCKHEFYQGCLKDWEGRDPVFEDKILPYFQDAFRLDIASNSYFGDISRPETNSQTWSTTKYDGVFKWMRAYYAAGVIPAAQGMAIPLVNMRTHPTDAFNVFTNLIDAQNPMMRSFMNSEKEFICDQPLVDGLMKYYQALGSGDVQVMRVYADGTKLYSFNGILIRPISIFEPILYELYGAQYSVCVLTLAGNFVFATDKKYGEGPNNAALRVWYNDEKLAWYYQTFIKAGTQIALPEHVVFAVPNV